MELPAAEPAEPLERITPRTPYDEVPYSSYPYSQTHPNRQSVVATLFGMTPAPVDRCRVLELGCASGGNLVPMAAAFPDASYLGVDLSARQIDDGVKTIRTLGLKNIELRQQSITEIDASMGKFDYIICHGVYSWVPESVRQKILEICGQQLNPQGVAYISYNTYPGWHMRGTVRDMMVYHVRKWDAPDDRVAHSRALLDFLVKTVPQSDAYSHLLRSEVERLRNTADSYVLHEHLETVNEPVYFYQFAEAAAGKGLQFIAEAQSGARYTEALGPAADQTVRQLARDVVEYEQYLDFLRNRMFRRSLVCRADVALDRNLDPKRVRRLYVASSAIAQGPINTATNEEAKFRVEDGTLSTGVPILKAAFAILGDRWPEAMSFEELLDQTRARLAEGSAAAAERSEQLADTLAANLAHSFTRRVVEFYATPPRLRATVEDVPRTSELARLQAAAQDRVTTLLHESVQLNDLGRSLVSLADGSRTRAEMLAELLRALDERRLIMVGSDQAPIEKPDRAAVEQSFHDGLKHLGRLGLLCA